MCNTRRVLRFLFHMENLLGTELLTLNDTGYRLVQLAIDEAKARCAGISMFLLENRELCAEYIELLIEAQIVEGQWSSMGIYTREQMGCVCATLRFVNHPTNPKITIEVLLPAFVRLATDGIDKYEHCEPMPKREVVGDKDLN